jgi:hypothetical protein
MRAYVVKLCVAAISYLAVHSSIILFLPAPLPAAYWVREMIVVKRHQADLMTSPKIVFIGGSSVLFGIDAGMVQTALHMPAENFGLHAGMRLDWLLAEGEQTTRAGDLLVLALEPNFYECGQNAWTQWQLYNALAWRNFRAESMPQQLRGVFYGGSVDSPLVKLQAYWDSKFRPDRVASRLAAMAPAEDIVARYESGQMRTDRFFYSAYNLDEHGDLLNTAGSEYKDEAADATQPDRVCPGIKDKLRGFIARLRGGGVRAVFEYFPFLIDRLPEGKWLEAEKRFARDIEEIGSTVIGRREEFFLPRNLFFNTIHHLNEDGRRVATTAIIRDLQKMELARSILPTN